ncbi:MAG: hypothetical protein KA408_10965 [Flavobacteriales bacterium]|nr:hypothetical protein [Flavobacteriales bacterium]
MKLFTASTLFGFAFAACVPNSTSAQINRSGTVHIAVGGAIGWHYTKNERMNRFSPEIDGGFSLGGVLDVQVGVIKQFSLGVTLEPGALVLFSGDFDAGTGFRTMGFKGRGYLLQSDKFAWTVSSEVGLGRLKYTDRMDEGEVKFIDNGIYYGISMGVGMYFSERVGLNMDLNWLSLTTTEHSIQKDGIVPLTTDEYYSYTPLPNKTRGLQYSIQVAFKF